MNTTSTNTTTTLQDIISAANAKAPSDRTKYEMIVLAIAQNRSPSKLAGIAALTSRNFLVARERTERVEEAERNNAPEMLLVGAKQEVEEMYEELNLTVEALKLFGFYYYN